ncbi:hypothetical protein LCGC14_1387540 [marine sediment metagenome]|uniref:Uncharacterized protein n=1 Tax=marine sediment metagenome TaxID=412755 RepID=A0A0F9K141_9ZZZZ
MKGRWQIRSNVKITVRDLEGKVLDVQEFHNLLTTVGLNMIRDVLAADVSDGETKYTAVGSDATVPALADTTLGTETFRKATTSTSKPGTGAFTHVVYIAPAEAVGAIEEIGWFCGAAAGAGADSGILLSRVLFSRVKTNLESIQVERTDTFAEA